MMRQVRFTCPMCGATAVQKCRTDRPLPGIACPTCEQVDEVNVCMLANVAWPPTRLTWSSNPALIDPNTYPSQKNRQ